MTTVDEMRFWLLCVLLVSYYRRRLLQVLIALDLYIHGPRSHPALISCLKFTTLCKQPNSHFLLVLVLKAVVLVKIVTLFTQHGNTIHFSWYCLRFASFPYCSFFLL